MTTKKKKLYFDVVWNPQDPQTKDFFLTQFKPDTSGDRYGHLLEDYDPLNSLPDLPAGAATKEMRIPRAVSAWFQPSFGTELGSPTNVRVIFVNATIPLSSATIIGSTEPPGSISGNDPSRRRHFGVRLTAVGSTAGFSGVLYVQRQHSIEA